MTAFALLAAAAPVGAQAPGLPVAASAFLRPGLAVAVNGGQASGRTTVAGAVGYGARSGRWQAVAGAGVYGAPDGFDSPALTAGGRLNLSVWQRGRLGATAFAGAGVARLRTEAAAGAEAATVSVLQLPVGVSAGIRGGLGDPARGRAWALSLAPAYVLNRLTAEGDALRASAFRGTAVVEVALSRRLGVSLAVEGGARAEADAPGPRGTVVGLGVALAR